MAQGHPTARKQPAQLLDSPEANLRVFAIQWPKGRQIARGIEPVVVPFYSDV